MYRLFSQPFTSCTARIKTREPGRTTRRYRFSFFSSFSFFKYRRVMWLIPSWGHLISASGCPGLHSQQASKPEPANRVPRRWPVNRVAENTGKGQPKAMPWARGSSFE
jgi:hypothetical protein